MGSEVSVCLSYQGMGAEAGDVWWTQADEVCRRPVHMAKDRVQRMATVGQWAANPQRLTSCDLLIKTPPPEDSRTSNTVS